ncbi:Clp protease N-terminal domain-containing protein [Kitasatospora viridis]|uniref:ATP-dependent Clp protease ATP-binding subunit ClpC n=1 Tax=Kitasatospora viridis TaxID=281105 RepID=A0A561SFC6_9ACTN|nr:Clp protease N-terminal domain-containing protein [Kitasatospora viridis]TWF73574.1 ATP-dependent Clp protease ATP-binding subunit ClpC [Kitasatospora viridis]
MFEYFTDGARRAVVLSQDEAIALGHDFIGTEHILLGLIGAQSGTAAEVLREQGVELDRARAETVRILDEAGVVAAGGQPAKDALAAIGIDVAEIQRKADDAFGPGAFQYPRPAYTPDAKRALEQTLREAKALGQERFGTEHILLGLLAVGEGRGLEVLTALEVDRGGLREAVLARVAQA